MNYIEKVRAEIKEYFDINKSKKGEEDVFISPDKKYRLEASNYWQNKKDVNWDITKVKIFNNQSQEKIFDFFVNDSHFFFKWLSKQEIEYLICAEDIFGGQTVIDLTNKKMASFSPNEDGFIWTDFHLSPDGNILATIGCFWACPYVIKIYDFKKPLDLPLEELNEIKLLDADETITGWLDNVTLKLKGIKREKKREQGENGGFSLKIVNEKPSEREINILV